MKIFFYSSDKLAKRKHRKKEVTLRFGTVYKKINATFFQILRPLYSHFSRVHQICKQCIPSIASVSTYFNDCKLTSRITITIHKFKNKIQ